jgi:hypothetical protein
LVLAGAHPANSMAAVNPIQVENALPGTTAWNLPGDTATSIAAGSTSIQGYASKISLQPGDILQLHVSTTPAAPYRVEIYRLGWYGGLGGRLITCLPSCGGSEAGTTQTVPSPDPNTGYLDAGWPVTDAVTVGPDWTTGYYVAKLVLAGGPDAGQASWAPFIVRDPPGTSSPILVQASVNTWEAYNNWGGKSLYAFNSSSSEVPASQTTAAAMVSFNRPFGTDGNAGPWSWELNMVRYLERDGYDVSYQADVDTDQDPASLLAHRLDVVSGHDEYWSPAMRNAYEEARAAGVNLAFSGADIGHWQMRYSDSSDHTIVEYRKASLDPDADPTEKTVPFASSPVNRPECELLGVGYPGGQIAAGDPSRSYSVTEAAISNPWFGGTGFAAGDTIDDSVGYEWDSIQPGCDVPPLQDLLHFAGLPGAHYPGPADAVTYSAPSGATVVSDGSLQLAWALDDYGHPPHADARVQSLFANILDSLGAPPGVAAPPSVPPTPPSPPAAPAELLVGGPGPFALRTPRPGAVLWSPQPRLIWSPSNDSAVGLAGYVVLVDGRRVGRTTATAFTLPTPLRDGAHEWEVVALDRAGNTRATPPRHLVIRSVRIRPRSRARELAHGLEVRVYCSRRCTIRAWLRVGAHGPADARVRHQRRAGTAKLYVALTAAMRARIGGSRSMTLKLTVRTITSGETRTVSLKTRL